MTFGPFHDSCRADLRPVYLAELRALVHVMAGPSGREATRALTQAMQAPDDASRLSRALAALEAVPSRPRRRALATFAALRRGDA